MTPKAAKKTATKAARKTAAKKAKAKMPPAPDVSAAP
ncbi:MAG TPA: DNA primase, partial [Alphaproteobacteria bacterium]|nr:DNA primase [Alphaproteobacteria bacterium]